MWEGTHLLKSSFDQRSLLGAVFNRCKRNTPEAGSELPNGVPTNRGRHGIRPELVIEEVTKAGFTHVRTIPVWLPEGKVGLFLVLFRR